MLPGNYPNHLLTVFLAVLPGPLHGQRNQRTLVGRYRLSHDFPFEIQLFLLGCFCLNFAEETQHPTIAVGHVKCKEGHIVLILELVLEGEAEVVLLAVE